MYAIQFSRHGEPAAVLRQVELPRPQPGPGEVRVRLTHRPVNPSDLLYISGAYGRRPVLPAVPGFEGVGRVDATGADVGLAAGTRVAVSAFGTWQESVVVPAADVLVLPDGIDDDVGAQLMINPFTARLLLHRVALPPGAWLVQTAGLSAVGRMIAQLAHAQGVNTVSTHRGSGPVNVEGHPSTDHLVDTSRADLLSVVGTLTHGVGVSAALDAVGGETGTDALRCLSTGGLMVSFGLLGGQPVAASPAHLIFRGLTVEGFWLPHYLSGMPPDEIARIGRHIIADALDGTLPSSVTRRYALTEVVAAVAHARRAGLTGKILLTG
ncbi:zinc-dependent alcohol dehydrogenase family protein [Micromonospora sp. WMMD730]|uniref:zinc-dependent alcohol dehydrogenase family protein n=1 Tax=Micromonospora sp. WMMD730 TaxID=3404128 RepID=UPI003B96553A